MSQSNELLAFRKRLKRFGYFDIHIKKSVRSGFWVVSACEPLGGYRIIVEDCSFTKYFRKRLTSHGGDLVYRPVSKPFDETLR